MCLTFQMMTLETYLTKNFDFFFRGYPLFGPSKWGVSKNDHPSTAYDPTFLLQKPFPLKKFGGYPLFCPSKCGVFKNDHPSTAYDPTFLLQNPFPHKKCGCLKKTRAQSFRIWPRYKGFKWKKKKLQNFSDLQMKNAVYQRVF